MHACVWGKNGSAQLLDCKQILCFGISSLQVKKNSKNSLGWYITLYIYMCFTSRVSCGVLSLISFLG